ncbi:hypothetical protein B0T19DRAFT_243499 [Cercophora scortea]|uniref:Uncharacterized protein n=1 Tax=Cercophora scortea TaxID=314031 RepID=A0AAE0M7A9_9PEZI|nr:hypothetical protein B0T19DRAFT_243499 [Cercophora scortea]
MPSRLSNTPSSGRNTTTKSTNLSPRPGPPETSRQRHPSHRDTNQQEIIHPEGPFATIRRPETSQPATECIRRLTLLAVHDYYTKHFLHAPNPSQAETEAPIASFTALVRASDPDADVRGALNLAAEYRAFVHSHPSGLGVLVCLPAGLRSELELGFGETASRSTVHERLLEWLRIWDCDGEVSALAERAEMHAATAMAIVHHATEVWFGKLGR